MGDPCCSNTIDVAALEARQRRVLIIVLAIHIATLPALPSFRTAEN